MSCSLGYYNTIQTGLDRFPQVRKGKAADVWALEDLQLGKASLLGKDINNNHKPTTELRESLRWNTAKATVLRSMALWQS
jgi:hypothetical protein